MRRGESGKRCLCHGEGEVVGEGESRQVPERFVEFELDRIKSLRAKLFSRAANDPASAVASVNSTRGVRRERDGVV